MQFSKHRLFGTTCPQEPIFKFHAVGISYLYFVTLDFFLLLQNAEVFIAIKLIFYLHY